MVSLWQKKTMLFMGCMSGVLVSLTFIRPYPSEITLAELVLQLSGARGMFALGTSLTELVRFMLCMAPNMLVIMAAGMQLYRHFCTAGVYVFSRQPNRLLWYKKSLLMLLVRVFLYEISFAAAAVLAALPRCHVMFSAGGFYLLGIHVLVYLLWIYLWSLLMNLLAIKFGSSRAFTSVILVQALCVASLAVAGSLEKRQTPMDVIAKILWWNPAAHTVLSWHQSGFLTKELAGSRYGFSLSVSVLLLSVLNVAAILAGGILIQRHDLLTENRETEEG